MLGQSKEDLHPSVAPLSIILRIASAPHVMPSLIICLPRRTCRLCKLPRLPTSRRRPARRRSLSWTKTSLQLGLRRKTLWLLPKWGFERRCHRTDSRHTPTWQLSALESSCDRRSHHRPPCSYFLYLLFFTGSGMYPCRTSFGLLIPGHMFPDGIGSSLSQMDHSHYSGITGHLYHQGDT
jgi:hypothetical protein